MSASTLMQRLGKDPEGREWYFADNQFTRPGVYYWNGERNVHAGDDQLRICAPSAHRFPIRLAAQAFG